MKQSRHKLAATIAERTLKQGSTKRFSRQVAAYLLSERRTGELDSLLRDVQADWSQAGYVEVLARSAHQLTKAVEADTRRQVKRVVPAAKRIVITPVIDRQLIGGVRLELANQQLDLSLRAKLDKFKQLTMTRRD